MESWIAERKSLQLQRSQLWIVRYKECRWMLTSAFVCIVCVCESHFICFVCIISHIYFALNVYECVCVLFEFGWILFKVCACACACACARVCVCVLFVYCMSLGICLLCVIAVVPPSLSSRQHNVLYDTSCDNDGSDYCGSHYSCCQHGSSNYCSDDYSICVSVCVCVCVRVYMCVQSHTIMQWTECSRKAYMIFQQQTHA